MLLPGLLHARQAGPASPLTRFAPHKPESGAVHHVRASLRRTWLPGRTELLTVGGMAFQDGSNIDLMRVRRCTIQIIGRDGTLTRSAANT